GRFGGGLSGGKFWGDSQKQGEAAKNRPARHNRFLLSRGFVQVIYQAASNPPASVRLAAARGRRVNRRAQVRRLRRVNAGLADLLHHKLLACPSTRHTPRGRTGPPSALRRRKSSSQGAARRRLGRHS